MALKKIIRNLVYLLFILILSIGCEKKEQVVEEQTSPEKGRFLDDWTYDVFIENNDVYKNTYKLWIPEGIEPRAILVLSVGGLGNGTNMVKNLAWKSFAKEEQLALLGTYVGPDFIESAENLRLAVRQIAKARGLEKIVELPYLLRGHSSGGIFSYVFAQEYKYSTLAWANIKGSMTSIDDALSPGLFIVGENDLESRNQSIESAFNAQRESGAFSAFALEPNVGHGGGEADPLIREYFSGILNKTLDNNGDIISIDSSEILLGNNQTLEIWSYPEYPGNKQEASCLIDSVFAKYWLEFQQI
jgi:hypothetical protein